MNKELHNELKREFQLERMILFSDAVFAIAITLLVIEMKVPEIPHNLVTEQSLVTGLAHLIPKFIGFLISFVLIGLYWTVHHRLFGFVVNFNQKLLWLNLFYLMGIVLMPFSTGFYSEYITHLLKSPVMIYVANISYIGITNFILWKYVSNPKHRLTEGLNPQVSNYFSLRAITVPVIFIIMALIYFIAPKLAVVIPLCIPILMRLIFAPLKKRAIASINTGRQI
ncbi:MAG TPA: TMEM175 family protein [Ferruginibacter sp.]|nr:TMEM175 family protein [Ferruginibacter sp.]